MTKFKKLLKISINQNGAIIQLHQNTANGDILTQADYEYTETDNIKIGDTDDKLEDLFTYVVDDTY